MPKITREEFSEFVRTMRLSAGLDQKALASLLNITEFRMKKYEASTTLPDDPYAFLYDLRQVIKQEIQSKKIG